jgi:predicted permease
MESAPGAGTVIASMAGTMMNGVLQDLRYAVRTLLRARGFTAVALAVLALGIGLNTAIFSVVNAVVLRPLPYAEPERLVELRLPTPGEAAPGAVSVVDFQDWREQSRSFADMALVNTLSRGLTLSGESEPEQLATAYVHPALFSTLAVPPALGRPLRIEDNDPGRNRVAVVSHALWRRRFGGDPAVVGRAVTLDGAPFTLVGVMGPAFRFPDAGTEVWAPESLIDAARAPRRRDTRYQRVIARLGPGVTLAQARAEMDTIAGRMAAQHPDTNAGRTRVTIVPLQESIAGESVRRPLLVLLGAVVLVLLISCANVGHLLFARTDARQREIAIRLALGAGRGRLLRQLLTESLVLALAGGALGAWVGAWSLEALLALSRRFLPLQNDVTVDGRVLAFALLASVVSALVFGVGPALRVSAADPQRALRDGGRGGSAGVERRRLRAVLVVAEVAVALVLVVGAALTLRSFQRLLHVDPGFRPQGLLTVTMNASSMRYPDRPKYMAFYRAVLDRVSQVPGVQSAASTRNLPLQGTPETWPVSVDGQPPAVPGSAPVVPVHQVSPRYFDTIGIPLLQGRAFADTDHETAPSVVVVSRAMAERFWPGRDAVGQAVRFAPDAAATATVVGVVGDVRQARLAAAGEPSLYVPQAQQGRRGFTLVLRVAGDPRLLEAAVRREILAVDPQHPIIRSAAMEDVMADALAQPRLMAVLLGTFGALALLLAALGTYAVIAYAVSLRTPEFGIRMALGATPRQVFRIVLREGAGLALVGVALGTATALAVTRLLASQLYGVSVTDAATYAAVAVLLLATTMLACYLPARRATRVDPLIALRYE